MKSAKSGLSSSSYAKRIGFIIVILCLAVPAHPQQTGTMTGNDGKVYRTVKIGDQWWMAENLRETRYRDGSEIFNYSEADMAAQAALDILARLSSEPTGILYEYMDSETKAATYGYLYNWGAVINSLNIAPPGWRVPTDEDWKRLEMHLGVRFGEVTINGRMVRVRAGEKAKAGDKLKATAHWNNPNTSATNESGFSALPGGGYRHTDAQLFSSLGDCAYFWSSTEYDADFAWMRYLVSERSDIFRGKSDKRNGNSVRLIKESGFHTGNARVDDIKP